jgi:hypothetical protein
MKKIVLLLVLFVYSFSFAQDNYKYVIVPKKFSFFKEENKYNLNEMTKSFFEKEGFQVVYDTDAFPIDLAENRCSALYINVIEQSNMLFTKIAFELKDCQNKLVLASKQGESRSKEYEKAYNESFREALISMRGLLNFKATVISTTKEVSVVASEEKINTANVVNENQLFAIPTSLGYKLVNGIPETIFVIHKTSVDSVFIAKKGILTGVLIKKSNSWFFEYYEGDKLLSEKVEVKF